jgi:ATP phosphoribosyltransferase
LYNRWQGLGVVTKVSSQYSYLLEADGKLRHVHANKIRKCMERIEQAVVNNCSVIYNKDTDFGDVAAVDTVTEIDTEKRPSEKVDDSKVAHLTVVERQQLFAVLDKYPTVFSDKPGFSSVLEHKIKVTPNLCPSVFVPTRYQRY